MGLMSLWTLWYRFMLYSVILTVIRIIIRSLLTHARTITQNTFKPLEFWFCFERGLRRLFRLSIWHNLQKTSLTWKLLYSWRLYLPSSFIQLSASKKVRSTACKINLLIWKCLNLVSILHFMVIGQVHYMRSLLLWRNMSSHYLLSHH